MQTVWNPNLNWGLEPRVEVLATTLSLKLLGEKKEDKRKKKKDLKDVARCGCHSSGVPKLGCKFGGDVWTQYNKKNGTTVNFYFTNSDMFLRSLRPLIRHTLTPTGVNVWWNDENWRMKSLWANNRGTHTAMFYMWCASISTFPLALFTFLMVFFKWILCLLPVGVGVEDGFSSLSWPSLIGLHTCCSLTNQCVQIMPAPPRLTRTHWADLLDISGAPCLVQYQTFTLTPQPCVIGQD